MKRIFILIIIATSLLSCGGSASKTQVATDTKQGDVTKVLYFHGKQRCVTCNAIEKLTKEVLDSLANEKIVMKVINLSKTENEAIADKYEVTWSSLILDRNGKVENLTDMGFSYAKGQPEVFKTKLIEAINNITK
ncbi:nitrophenyl compound nitroreductase subunit ArsF family protein [Bacteroides sp.]|uniref:nitrophenyl compound nitroreductase subunit ArsF family protein n=1 Tax=Bacteroides sp. TaxID=29523 RepID=UPI002639B675|nr:nitrophenyl compound nitroreductase subunit ArsF family protein [Bacteroides sp.]MDD3037437.1 nitrophenyl compound nitroreductase subunit ArsF family protein [Bacteroides sp.]